jgi:hypothetical protein
MPCCNACKNPITRARKAREARASGIVHVGAPLLASPASRAILLDGSWSSLTVDATNCAAFAVNTPSGKGFDADLTGWKIFFEQAANSILPTSDADLDGWQGKLSGWQTQIKAAGCKVTGPPVAKPQPPPPGDAAQIAKFAAIGAVAIAAAILIGKV